MTTVAYLIASAFLVAFALDEGWFHPVVWSSHVEAVASWLLLFLIGIIWAKILMALIEIDNR